MPDWKEFVQQRLRLRDISSSEKEEIARELAAHLEEVFAVCRNAGLKETESITAALDEVGDWQALAAEIRRAKLMGRSMNHRTRSLWFPALLTLLGASSSLMLTQFLRFQPHLVWVHGIGVTLYWPWLATLPLFGAMGAYLSQRARGSIRARLAAGLSPALIMLIVMLLILPWALAIDGVKLLRFIGFGMGLANWVALPAFALLLGILPFLGNSRLMRPQAS